MNGAARRFAALAYDEPCLEERTMSDESANSCISHLSIGTNDFPRARAFYTTR